MDRAMQQARLAQAERHIASVRRYIERQEQIIADLERDGCDITIALDLLTTFRHEQDQNVAQRDRILKELEQ
jgi:hypothetical protein